MPAYEFTKSHAMREETFLEGDVDEDFLVRFADETGWKSLLLYQFLSGYIVIIALTGVISTSIAWLEMMHLIITPNIPKSESAVDLVLIVYFIDLMYLVDILFRILYAIVRWPNKKLINEPVPVEFIILDILSVIPYDVVYGCLKYDPLTSSILRLRVIIRLYRIATVFNQLSQMFQQISIFATIFWSLVLILLGILIPSSIHFIAYCSGKQINCTYRNYNGYIIAYATASHFMLGDGADLVLLQVEEMYHLYSFMAVIYFVATMCIVAALACKKIDRLMSMYSFIHDYQKTMKLYQKMKIFYINRWTYEDEQIYFTLKDYYYLYLRQRNGISAERVLNKILPPSLTNRIIMDMALDSFRHSHVFRNLELHIVRFLSSLVTFEFAVPGEIIVRKGDMFNKMIYISHGVVQILSHEDGETTVLNLSGGTSLGETTLFVSYPMNCTIVSQSFCELVVIKKSAMIEMMECYPTEYRELVKIITERFEDSKKLFNIVRGRLDPQVIKTDLLVMTWIKEFQRCLLAWREKDVKDLDLDDILSTGLQSLIDTLIFYVPYLDKLVVSEEIELVKDTVFLKSSFHFILQPKSQILMVWNIAVLLLTIIFIIIYPFSLSYPDKYMHIQAVCSIFITFVFWIDIYLQMFTAVKTRGATYLTFRTILGYRIRHKTFIIDCFAALPIEYFILFLSGSAENVTIILLQANRILKYYRIVSFFDDLNLWSTGLLTVFNYIKYITHFLFFYYYAAMFIHNVNCYEDLCSKEFVEILATLKIADSIGKLVIAIPLSNSLVTGVILGRMPDTDNPYVYLGYAIIGVCAYLLKTLFLVNVISSSAVQKLSLLKEQERLLGIDHAMDWFEVTKSYKRVISDYLNTLFYFNSEIYSQFNDMYLPNDLSVSFRNIHLTRILKDNTFFGSIPTDILSFLSAHVKLVIIPAGLVVFYSGQPIDECYVIQRGYCTTWYGNIKREVTINENLGLVEVLMDIPIFHNVVTASDCILIKFSKLDIHRFCSQYVNEGAIVNNALREFDKCKDYLSYTKDHNANPLGYFNELVRQMDANRSTVERLLMCEIANQYTKKFRFRSIPTCSRYLLYWEITKNIAWVLSMYLTGCLHFTDKSLQKGILLTLDMFSFADVFIRMYVSFFDKNGIEITKCSKTFLHYLSHAFIIDVISVFPFDLFVVDDGILFARFNRFIQCYRIFGFAFYSCTRIKKVHQYVYIAHFMIFLLLTQNFATFYVQQLCDIVNLGAGQYSVECDENSWIKLSLRSQPGLYQVYAETYLFLLSVFFGIGFRRYVIVNVWERLILSVWCVLGYLTVILIAGRAISDYMFRNADLTTYQEAMKDLVRFLSYCDIDKSITYEVIQYFEYVWEKRQGKDICDIIGNFPPSVKKDLLFNIYGKFLRKNASVFNYAEDNFLKSLLMIVNQKTFRKTGILYKVDDIHGTIFFLLKGNVDVIGPDMNRLLTLSVGSLFGCLDDCKESRQTLTMVANGHVETLTFSSQEFYNLLLQHPKFHARFLNMTNMQFDFISSQPWSQKTQSQKLTSRASTLTKLFLGRKIRTKIMKPSKYLTYCELALFVIEFFLGSLYELLLQAIISDMPFWLLAYFRDSLWFLRMYFKFHVAYEDEFGMLEFNRKKIALRYIHQKNGFYFDLLCILPLDCLSFAIQDDLVRNKLFLCLRLNRFFRCFHFFLHMSRTTKKLNINVLLMRTIYTLMYAFVYVEIKFIVYYWSETHWDPIYESRWNQLKHALIYFDTILFIFARAPVPFENIYENWAASVLFVIISLDACLFIFFFSCFAGTLQIATKVKSKYLKFCRHLKLLMLMCDASSPLIEQIQMYNNLLLRLRNGIQFPFLLEHAPFYLREAVLNSMFGFHLRNHYLFKDCHIDFLRQLAATMRTLIYFDGDNISNVGDIDETMYFIQEGVVQALTKDTLYSEVCEHLLVAGESFGLNQILYPSCGQYYAHRVSMLTTVVTIKRSEFIRLLTFFPGAKKHIYGKTIEFAS